VTTGNLHALSETEGEVIAQGNGVFRYEATGAHTAPPGFSFNSTNYWIDPLFISSADVVAADFSGNGRHGTLTQGPTWTNGKRGRALSFDGSNDRVAFTGFDAGTTNSATAWIDFQDADEGVVVGGPPFDYLLFIDQTNFYYSVGVGNFVQVAHGGLTAGQWTHVAVSRSGTSVTFYRNGVQLGTPQTLSNNVPPLISTIGSYSDATFPMQAKIDDVRIYNRALTGPEVARLYGSGAVKINASSADLDRGSSLERGLIGHWTMDGKETRFVVDDSSGNGYGGTFSGGTLAGAKTIGKLGQALSFDGVDDELSTPPIAQSAGNTVAFWMKDEGTLDTSQVLFRWADTILCFPAADNDPEIDCRPNGTSDDNVVTTVTDVFQEGGADGWFHIALTVTDGAQQIYVNGVLEDTDTGEFSPDIGNVYMGTMPFAQFYKGLLDDVRLYNRILTAGEVEQLYQLGRVRLRP
jgi:hypothetical protein